MLRQARARFKVFTQGGVASYVPPISPLFRSWLYIDRCADELVDAFIAVPVTSLFRDGVLRRDVPSRSRLQHFEVAYPSIVFPRNPRIPSSRSTRQDGPLSKITDIRRVPVS